MAKPRVPSKNVDLMKLKAPGSGAPAAQMPLLPNQVVFRHKAWLPWWVALLLPLLLLLALLLFLFLPTNVVVPEVTGAKSTFEAEKTLTEAELKLAPRRSRRSSTEAPPGTVIGQTPAAGEKAKKDSEVAIEIAVGNGKVEVPNVVGKTQADANQILREASLTVGQAHPQPPDPKAKISARSRRPRRSSRRARRSTIFTADPRGKKKGDGKVDEEKRRRRQGGGKAAAVMLPALAGLPVAEAAQKAAEPGLVPEQVNRVLRQEEGHADRDRSRRRAPSSRRAPRSSCSSPPASRSSPTTTARTSCSPTAPTASALPRSPRAPRRRPTRRWSFDGTQIAYAQQPPRVPQGPGQARRAARSRLTAPADEVYATSRGRRRSTST